MKITIEEIYGVNHTVVFHRDCPKYNIRDRRVTCLKDGSICFFVDAECMTHVATALPPLPRHPRTINDARLMELYKSHGLRIFGRCITAYESWDVEFSYYSEEDDMPEFCATDGNGISENTHAMYNGERVEIAIREDV